MSWRIVTISNRAKLELSLNYLVIRKEETTRIHLSEISLLIVESTEVSLTASLMCELMKNKIKVIFCDNKRDPCFELMPYYGSFDTSEKIRQQIAWSNNAKAMVWTEIVSEKIRKQSEFLEELAHTEESNLLKLYLEEMEFNDTNNREGLSAKVYFNAIFGKDFTRTEENLINAGLNYGYSIILSVVNREVVKNGYLTQLGIFHKNGQNQFNLGSDLMEPFRVLVDRKVLQMDLKKFEHEEKMQLVDILNKEIIINGKKQYVNNAIGIYCKSIFEALNNSDTSTIKFYRMEMSRNEL